jgi:hypothetical protein
MAKLEGKAAEERKVCRTHYGRIVDCAKGTRASILEEKIERWIVQNVTSSSSVLMRATVWIVFIAGYLLSAVIFFHWFKMSFGSFLFGDFQKPKEIIHALLLSIEVLILTPVPAIVGLSAFRVLMHLSEVNEFDHIETTFHIHTTEQMLINGLVTVTGTSMIDLLVMEAGTWVHFCGGTVIILSLTAFLKFSGH